MVTHFPFEEEIFMLWTDQLILLIKADILSLSGQEDRLTTVKAPLVDELNKVLAGYQVLFI
jgi:hypothetical protein